jgi:M6 family metalloprotease-like protein
MRASQLLVLAWLVPAFVSGLAAHSAAASGERSKHPSPAPADVVSIRADVNGLAVTLRSDGMLEPASGGIGIAEQFEVHDLGNGLIALRSVANAKFVSARALQPLRADAEQVGDAQRIRTLGDHDGLVRLRSPAAKGVVCASLSGQGPLVTMNRCPHGAQLFRFEAVQIVPPSFTISFPAPGTVLATTAVTFRWDAGADEYWLKVGSVPGASDIYDSGSLKTASEQRVSGLPLNGQKLYVRLSRRIGNLIEGADVEYTAAIRKGIAIITDFADRRLEDWTGVGFRSVADVRAQLAEMERYWTWLSRDLEKFQWDIVRIQLPQDANADAYPNWIAFRETVVALARQQVATRDYDVDSDDEIDALWVIVSSGSESVPFAIGGASGNGGACVFVDGQASGSVEAGATGNFTHEFGHCLGFPDMYGTYSTLNKLTVMNDPWALPPQDFSAYERVALGWVRPQLVGTTTYGVWLPSANDNFAAVKIPTTRPNEYFLIEYRNPPATGYGSATQGYRGLAVYHVLAESSMGQDPPVVKLEPADGTIAPNQPLDPNDFVYPENPELLRPLILRSYYGDRDAVFQIENVVWRDGGLAFDVLILPQHAPANLLLNGSFESGQSGMPEVWTPGWFVPQDALFAWPESSASNGTGSASLQSTLGNDIRWSQSVATTTGAQYQLCGYLKGDSVAGVQGDVGGNVSVMGGMIRSNGLSGTFDWTRMCVAFVADTARIEVACRLGFYGSTAEGKLWCDDFTLERVRLHSAFEPFP